MIWTVNLLGLDYASLPVEQVTALIAARKPDAPFRYVVTPNADHLVRLWRNPDLLPLYQSAWLRVLDSRVVARAALLCGLQAPAVCPGSDIMAALARTLAYRDTVTVIGGSRRVFAALGPTRIHRHSPPFGFEHDKAALARAAAFVCERRSRYVFLAVGSPRQEILAAAIMQSGGACGTGLCIGGSLAFLTGEHRRAPYWMQACNLEWAHRLGAEPARLARRYLVDSPAVFALLLRERLLRS
jgi:exopolysaccharide biosynthesis WecB/TagA/CpsF family protein